MTTRDDRPHRSRSSFPLTVAAFVILFVVAVVAGYLTGR